MSRAIIEKDIMFQIFQEYLDLSKKEKIGWEEFSLIANETHNLNFTSSAFRKKITAYLEAQEYFEKISNPDYREKILNLRELRLESEKNKVKDLNNELRELKKEYLRNNELNSVIATFVSPSKEFRRIDPLKSPISNIFILSDEQCIGDGHTFKIYEYIYNEILNIIENEKLEEIYIFSLGDLIEGLLRTSAFRETKQGYVGQIREMQENLALLLEKLSQKVKINYAVVNSNHTEIRPLGVSAGNLKSEDITILILEYCKAYLKNNPNIKWLNNYKKPEDLNYEIINIQNYNVYLTHGDLKAGSPKNCTALFDKINRYYDYDIDFTFMGHFHHSHFEHISQNKKKNSDKMVLYFPSLDCRLSKTNESSLLLSSTPAFSRVKIEKNKGLTVIETIRLPKQFWN